MSKRVVFAVAGVLLIAIVLIVRPWRNENTAETDPAEHAHSQHAKPGGEEGHTVTNPAPAPLAAAPRNAKAINKGEALEILSNVAANSVQPNFMLENLTDALQRLNQKPTSAEESNPYTGKLTIVRTESPFPGTRYFHAQYFSDDGHEPFLQHISFEFEPGPESFKMARTAMEKAFPGLGEPQTEQAGYANWDLGNGYILWIKTQTWEDLQDHPTNVYTEEDIGSIKVAIELEIH